MVYRPVTKIFRYLDVPTAVQNTILYLKCQSKLFAILKFAWKML